MRRFIKFVVYLLLLLVLLAAGFRVAAMWREVDGREVDRPRFGKLVNTALGDVYIEEAGFADATPVLLVHGSVGWARFWHETSTALAKEGYRPIAFDLAPMGYSARDEGGDYSRQRQAQRIIALTETLDVKPIMIAHSFGAGPATEAVMMAPEAFASYVIVDGAIGVGSDVSNTELPLPLQQGWLREVAVSLTITNPWAMKPLLQMFLHKKGAASPEYVDLLKKPLSLRGTTEEIAKWLPTLLVPPADALSTKRDNYAQIDIPTGIIWGAEDTATPLAQGEELNELIKGSTLTVLEGLGHIPQIEDPTAFQDALLDMLKGF